MQKQTTYAKVTVVRQRAIHLRQGYGGLKAGMKPPMKKGQWKGNGSSLIHAHLKSKMQNRWAIVFDVWDVGVKGSDTSVYVFTVYA